MATDRIKEQMADMISRSKARLASLRTQAREEAQLFGEDVAVVGGGLVSGGLEGRYPGRKVGPMPVNPSLGLAFYLGGLFGGKGMGARYARRFGTGILAFTGGLMMMKRAQKGGGTQQDTAGAMNAAGGEPKMIHGVGAPGVDTSMLARQWDRVTG